MTQKPQTETTDYSVEASTSCANCGLMKSQHSQINLYCPIQHFDKNTVIINGRIVAKKFQPKTQELQSVSDYNKISLDKRKIPQNQSQDYKVERRVYKSDPSTKQDKPMKSDKGVLPVSPDTQTPEDKTLGVLSNRKEKSRKTPMCLSDNRDKTSGDFLR